MKVALGFKAHSGWAALVVMGRAGRDIEIIDRQRVELTRESDAWAKAPYHAAEPLAPGKARELVKRGIASAMRVAVDQMRGLQKQLGRLGHEIVGCAVLEPGPMPGWTTDEILAVHFRMHKAEGVLFPDAIGRAATLCGLRLMPIAEKELDNIAKQRLGTAQPAELMALGKSAGPPWARDQKTAALAALIALNEHFH